MNPIDDQLNRLFRAAQNVPSPEFAPPPFGLETRVLAAWRGAGKAPVAFWDSAVLTRGLILAGIIMAVSILPALNSSTVSTASIVGDEVSSADSSVDADAYP
jgi:hypothetical protein